MAYAFLGLLIIGCLGMASRCFFMKEPSQACGWIVLSFILVLMASATLTYNFLDALEDLEKITEVNKQINKYQNYLK